MIAHHKFSVAIFEEDTRLSAYFREQLEGLPLSGDYFAGLMFAGSSEDLVATLSSGELSRTFKLNENDRIEIEPERIQPLLGFVMGGQKNIHLDPITQIRRHVNTTLQVLGSLLNKNSDVGVRQLSGMPSYASAHPARLFAARRRTEACRREK